MGGIVGVDYSSLYLLLEAYQIPRCYWKDMVDKIHVINSVAVKYWNKDDGEQKSSNNTRRKS